jgi:predicted TIM-barrel fold metal-dependent hydrolase
MTLKAMHELDLSQADKENIFYRNAKQLFRFTEG